MKNTDRFSILHPMHTETNYRQLSQETCHDLGLDTLCAKLTNDAKERNIIMNILTEMTSSSETAEYRREVFGDILRLPDMRERLMKLFEEIEYYRNFTTLHKSSDEKQGIWHLMHRLDEIDGYIKCIETMREVLSASDIHSEGLKSFLSYISELYDEAAFSEMKKDISELRTKTADIKSVTLGINVNERFEAVSMGLVSVNSKPFYKSGIVGNFADAIASRNRINDSSDWDGSMRYHQVDRKRDGKILKNLENLAGFSALSGTPMVDGSVRSTIVGAVEDDAVSGVTFYLENVINKMLDSLVKKLSDTLTKYANIAILDITQLIPEFIYYIRFAEFIDGLISKGHKFCAAKADSSGDISMDARGLYNLKLAISMPDSTEIICNDLVFDTEHTVYILTGANRGGKTTITQAVGLLYVLAQGGIHVPADSFVYRPVDCIYTHFPADEDKTMDLGRLGEECVRFKEIYSRSTSESLILLNETFSTTSFEEGYYIAQDSLKAMLKKGARTIYNTHMHKLAREIDEINSVSSGASAASLVMRNDNGKRSFRVEVSAPEGSSYARDIAEKYGVTYEMLTGE